MKILITGSAGFIGFHLVNRLVKEGYEVVGLDNINDYYDVNLKYARLKETGILKEQIDNQSSKQSIIQSSIHPNYCFIKMALEDDNQLMKLFDSEKFDYVVNLAAQVGVRYSLQTPKSYINSNIVGFANLLEACKQNKIKHLIYASSSSVYGLNTKIPFSASDNVDHPISLYAATKKSNELMAHTYSYLYNLPTTGIRFFTVYGPWGRPDMAMFKFTKAILNNEPIDVYNNGNMIRDFTYIDDVIEGLILVINLIPQGKKSMDSNDPSTSVAVNNFIEILEKCIGKKAKKNLLPLQPGEVLQTNSDVTSLEQDINYKPSTCIETGIKNFINWYKNFYRKV